MSLTSSLTSPLRRHYDRLSEPTKGLLWMIGASACMTTVVSLIRLLNQTTHIHALEIAFFRNLFSLLIMVPWILRVPREVLRTRRPVMHALRSACGLTAMMLWFYSVTIMPLAEAVTLSFTKPLFATLLAAVLLRETVRLRRWSATAIGFLGVLVVLRPGTSMATGSEALIGLAGAMVLAATMMFIKSLARTERTATMMFYTMFWMTPLSLGPALLVWQTPDLPTLLWLLAIGTVATGVQGCLAQAFHHADASFLAAVDYAILPMTALSGWLLFGEVTDIWTWVGAGIIAGSSVYIVRREARISRQLPVSPEPLQP